jgi:hypothetical protein
MAGVNGIIGDDFNTELPQTEVDDTQFNEMKKTARFIKTQEYKDLKAHFDARVEFYQQYLPNGKAIGAQEDTEKMGRMWMVANVIIGELKAVLLAYEQAAEYVKDESSRRKGA